MTVRKIVISLSCFVVVLVLSGFTRFQTLQQVVLYGLINNHYTPVAINDSYSAKIFDEFIEQLDPAKRFFTQEDIVALSVYKYTIDDQIKKNDFKFFNEAERLYNKRLDHVKGLVGTLFNKPYYFKEAKYIETDKEKRKYPKNLAQLDSFWKDAVKHQVLSQYISLKQAELTGNQVLTDVFDAKLEKKSREKVKEEVVASFERLKKETKAERLDYYFNTFGIVFDTHSNYYPAEKKEDFDINISGHLEGIGAVLSEQDGFIKVASIVPGSPSWKQGSLKEEDIILKVGQGNKTPVDLVGARVRDAVDVIRGKKGTVVTLTVKHPDQRIEVIQITRDVVIIEETYAKHAVVKDKRSGNEFGYIYLPKFYRDFKDASKRNTTDDIKKAINDLKQKKVQGIVIDLRNNSGGALFDAVNTAGLFIESGPIVQVKGKSFSNNVLQDQDKAVYYSGSLVILVNSFSASASEILAAALQDYGRAVIVGADTFGKGTVQTFIDLDEYDIKNSTNYKDLGSIKVTVQKFYRISGQSTQRKGVVPDIHLPNLYSHLEVGERYLDYAMPWDTIPKLNYKLWFKKPLDLKGLQAKSSERVNQSPAFKAILKHIDYVNQQKKTSLAPLLVTEAIKEKIQSKKESDAYDKSIQDFADIDYISPDIAGLTVAQKESYKDWIKELKKDPYLYEAFAILNDLNNELAVKQP